MAEVTAMRNNALPYPVYAAPYALVFPILDADGDPVTSAVTPDSEVSKNGDTFADCTNEIVEIGATGIYYLLLTAAEMTADVVAVRVTTGSASAKTSVLTLYPRKLVPLRSGTAQGGAAGYITLDAGAGAVNDKWNGVLCVATIDGNVEARIIDDYDGSNQQGSVTPDWNVAPDADDTFVLYLPEGVQIPNGEPMRGTDSAFLAASAPDNFSALLINANGHISRVSLVDLLTLIDTNGIPAAALSAAAVTKIEAALLNEGDGQALIDAIVQAIDAADIDTDILPALIRDAILNRVLAGNHDTAGSVGKVLQDIIADTGTDIPALIAALNNLSAAQVRTEADAALAAYDGPTNTEMNARTLASASYATAANQTTMDGKLDTLLTRITATLFAGITSLANWLGAMAGKHAPDATAETEINATGAGGGDFSAVTDSLQANRDSGGGGGGGTNVHVEQQSVVIKGSAS
ncbi:MAG: hypothetical protein IT430_09855 [Phycisphaerales bacterium]|nr:hypothetical protein [Phycisphaerales bacterium]